MSVKRSIVIAIGVLLVLASGGTSPAQPRRDVTFRKVTDPKRREELMEHLVSIVPDELNVARGKPATSSAPSEGEHKPEHAVDGDTDRGSAWWGRGTPMWFQVDLGKPITIGAVRIYFYWDGRRYYQYTVEVSLDGKTWQRVVDESRNTTPSTPKGFARMFPPVQARYVRVHILKNSVNQSGHIAELKIYAHEGDGEPGQIVSPTPAPGDAAQFGGQLSVADNGILQLYFAERYEQLVTIRYGGKWLGSVCCAVAQFEKKGVGYKGAGVGSARATAVKKVEPVSTGPEECIVDVTAERTHSRETMRRFEATYRFTLRAGQSWFEGRLLCLKNTDKMPYELRGYYHLLQPAGGAQWGPICFSTVAGWTGKLGLLGAMVREPGDFMLGLRTVSATPRGEITRKVGECKIDPNMTWERDEPSLIIFAGKKATEKELVGEGRRIKRLLSPAPVEAKP